MAAYPKFDIILEALNLSSVGVIITDAEQKNNPIIFVNTGFENITGYTKEDALGSNCHFLQGKIQIKMKSKRFVMLFITKQPPTLY